MKKHEYFYWNDQMYYVVPDDTRYDRGDVRTRTILSRHTGLSIGEVRYIADGLYYVSSGSYMGSEAYMGSDDVPGEWSTEWTRC